MDIKIADEVARLASRVRAERRLHGLRQDELASMAGVPLRTYKRFEGAECDSLSVMLRIACALEEVSGPGRLVALERLFPGGVKETASGTPLGRALQKLERTRALVGKRNRKRDAAPKPSNTSDSEACISVDRVPSPGAPAE